jgi:hypothetical protein
MDGWWVAAVTALVFSMQRPDGSAAGQGWVSCVNILATGRRPTITELRGPIARSPAAVT